MKTTKDQIEEITGKDLCSDCINGLFLCAVCENKLAITVYGDKSGFWQVTPCPHCAKEDETISEIIQPLT